MNTKFHVHNNQRTPPKAGFALIASLSIMAVLVLIAVALYSLSSVASRSASIAAAQTEARANAKAALMMAIGDLQKYTGPDTRVTAPAELKIPNAPVVTGAWKSWEGLNHDPSNGRPIAEINGTSIYGLKELDDISSDKRFLTWLISGEKFDESNELVDLNTLVTNDTATLSNTVPLLADGSLQTSDTRQIHIVPTVNEDGSRYAWWVSAENQKARLMQPYNPRSNDASDWADLAKSYAVPDPASFGLDELLSTPETFEQDDSTNSMTGKVLNLSNIELLNPATAQPHHNFHDVSASATGLLTNTATGGWRKDLSILSEKWTSINNRYRNESGAAALPLFRYFPSTSNSSNLETSAAQNPTTSAPTPSQSIFYPWSDYGTANGNSSNPGPTDYYRKHGAVASWRSMVSFLTSYKDINYNNSSGIGSMPMRWARTHRTTSWGVTDGNFSNEDLYSFLHELQNTPSLARVQWVFNFRSRRWTYDDTQGNYNRFNLDMMVSPVYTLWNPLNVAVSIDHFFGVRMNKTFPVAIGIGRNADPLDYRRYTRGSRFWTYRQGNYDNQLPGNYTDCWDITNGQGAGFPEGITLAPGEVKSFSLNQDAFPAQGAVMAVLKPGFDGTDLHGFLNVNRRRNFDEDGNEIAPDFLPRHIKGDYRATDTLNVGLRFDNMTQLGPDANHIGPGIMFNMARWGGPGATGNHFVYLGDAFKTYSMQTSLNFSTTYWEEPSNFPSLTMLDILVEPSDETGFYDSYNDGNNPPWTPYFSVVFGPRISIGAGAGNSDDRPTKGVLQNNPFTIAVLTTSDSEWQNHPANIPFDFSIHAHEAGGSPTVPSDSINSEGYLFTGMDEGNGLSRLIMTELPLRPIASLPELQHWNLQGNKAVPPFQYNIIGNSDAHPLIEPNSILPPSPLTTEVGENLQHDDAYCANHLLFDDWFVSSIAPEPTNFGSDVERDIEAVYEDFLEGNSKLTNRAYQPIAEDQNLTSTEARDLADNILNGSDGDGWLKVASRFEVEGMFNVNSTSVSAWRALLGHARQQQVAHHTQNGIVLDSAEFDYVVSRSTVASDSEAGGISSIIDPSQGPENASEYAGFRTLSSNQLDELARNIADEVRARGPFLSLAEFINRQLSSNEDLAIAGALQAAINSMSDDPLAVLKNQDTANSQVSSEVMDPAVSPNNTRLDGAGYVFEEAARGYSTHGFPGWIRQADVLRPIAPVLSARDDTFTIRAYGDKLDAEGNVIARAWCEATVQRNREFVDPSDEADSINTPINSINQTFGRRYQIKSFRWLAEDEV